MISVALFSYYFITGWKFCNVNNELLFSIRYFTSKQVLFAEFAWIKGLVDERRFELVFSHGDPWWGNIVYNKHKGLYYIELNMFLQGMLYNGNNKRA